MNSGKRISPVVFLAALVYVVALTCLAPIRTGFQFGGDEGHELMKALLVSRGHPLYKEVWNDQPPLYTLIVGGFFWLIGPSAFTARIITVGFSALLLLALYGLVAQAVGYLAALIAVLLLFASAHFMELSVSAMLEVPALAVGLCALWAATQYSRQSRLRLLVTSGALFACALQVKLSAALFLPAILMELFERKSVDCTNATVTKLRSLGFWGSGMVFFASVGIVFSIIAFLFYDSVTISIFLKSHFSKSTKEAAELIMSRWNPCSILSDLGPALSCIGLFLFLPWTKERTYRPPIVLLTTVICFHCFHQPYWYYYGLHFAIPVSWLAPVGLVEWGRLLKTQKIGITPLAKFTFAGSALCWCICFSIVFIQLPDKIASEANRLLSVQPASQNRYVKSLTANEIPCKWIFTDRSLAAFWANSPIPPELSVIPLKRIWSESISKDEVLRCLTAYRPEIVMIPGEWENRFGIAEYLRSNYKLNIESMTGESIYLRLNPDLGDDHQ